MMSLHRISSLEEKTRTVVLIKLAVRLSRDDMA